MENLINLPLNENREPERKRKEREKERERDANKDRDATRDAGRDFYRGKCCTGKSQDLRLYLLREMDRYTSWRQRYSFIGRRSNLIIIQTSQLAKVCIRPESYTYAYAPASLRSPMYQIFKKKVIIIN